MQGSSLSDRARACRGARGQRILNEVMPCYKQHSFARRTTVMPMLSLACTCTTLSHDIRYENESHATTFEPRSRFHQCGNRRGMRMADGDRESIARGIA